MNILLDFIINDLFRNAAVFIAFIAIIGLLIQRKSFSEVLSGGAKTALGQLILTQGVNFVVAAIAPLSAAYLAMNPTTVDAAKEIGSGNFAEMFGTEIGIVMLLAFAINIIVARLTRFKTIFLTGHMLYWFPFVFIAVGYGAGLKGVELVVLATIFTAFYMIVSPNLLQPYVRAVTGDNSFAIGHPTTCLSLLAGTIARFFGNKKRSTEDINMPKGLSFLKEVGIASSIVISLTFLVFAGILAANGLDYVTVFELNSALSIITYALLQGLSFGAGITVMMLGVRMMIGELVPAFKGISEKLVPNAIPALDCAIIFPYAPNAMVIAFITSMVTSILTIIVVSSLGIFQTVILPLTVTCCFEIGTAGVISNAQGGLRGTILGTAAAGIVMVLLVGIGAPYFMSTINSWILVYGGQDFSLWGIIEGVVAGLFT